MTVVWKTLIEHRNNISDFCFIEHKKLLWGVVRDRPVSLSRSENIKTITFSDTNLES